MKIFCSFPQVIFLTDTLIEFSLLCIMNFACWKWVTPGYEKKIPTVMCYYEYIFYFDLAWNSSIYENIV